MIPQTAEVSQAAATNPMRTLVNSLIGINRFGRKALNVPSNISQYLSGKGIDISSLLPGGEGINLISNLATGKPFQENIKNLRIPTGLSDIEKFALSKTPLNPLGRTEEGDRATQGLVESLIPAIVPGGISAKVATAAATSTAPGENPIATGLMFGLPGIAKKVAKADLSPSGLVAKFARGNLPIEEIEANARAAEGTNTPIGRILGEPKLTGTFENISLKTPLGKGGDILNELKGQVEKKAEEVLENLEPSEVSGDLNDLTQSLLEEAYNQERNIKNELYKERNEIAEKEGHVLELPIFEKTAKEITKSIEESPLYKDDPEFRKQYNRVMGYEDTAQEIPGTKSKILDHYGNPIETKPSKIIRPSLTEAQVTKGDLYSKGEKLSRSNDPKTQVLGKNLKKLASALDKDIENSIKSGSSELQAAHEKANTNYKEKFSPFKDDTVWEKLIQENPEKIVREIIKPGKKADQYKTIEKIINLLPENKKNILGYTYLKGAIDKHGNVSPKELAALIDALGNRQFKALFPDAKIRQNLTDFGNLRGMNSKALDVLFNAETGVKAIPWLYFMEFLRNPQGAIAMSMGSRISNKWMTDPKVRSEVIKKISEISKTPVSSGPLSKYLVPALQAQRPSQESKQ
jgi:hypothetical protein